MTTLAGMQAALQRALCGDDRDVELLVVSDGRLDAARRVAIYRHACVTRLVGALAEAYPALRQALGERRFEDLAREYVAAHPSRSASIRWFGRELADFLETRGRGLRWQGLAELARWEWTLALAFDAADARPVDEHALAGLAPADWGRLCLRFVPSLQRIDLATNALDGWRAATQGAPRPTRWRRESRVSWVAWRRELTTSFRSMAADEASCLDAALQGRSFADLCASLASTVGAGEAPLRAATLLRTWIAEGWIGGFELA
ncbi:MAG: DNA-binding domain-containing protein [Steroidobacteraceae bacterium]